MNIRQTGMSNPAIISLAALIALGLSISFGSPSHASAHAPHPGLDFSLGIDTNGDMNPDCGTGAGQLTNCIVPAGRTIRAYGLLNALGTLPGYAGYDVNLFFDGGVMFTGDANPRIWPSCVFDAHGASSEEMAFGCANGTAGSLPSTYTGPLGSADFQCTADGRLRLLLGDTNAETFGTHVATDDAVEHSEAQDVFETVNIDCVEPVGGVASDVHLGDSASYLWGVYTLGALVVIGLAGLTWAASRRRAR